MAIIYEVRCTHCVWKYLELQSAVQCVMSRGVKTLACELSDLLRTRHVGSAPKPLDYAGEGGAAAPAGSAASVPLRLLFMAKH